MAAKKKPSATKKKKGNSSKTADKPGAEKRTRQARPYPASSFRDALPLGQAIMKFAGGDKIRRLTLMERMGKSPNSSATKMMITNSGKYAITKGSYVAEFLELTDLGKRVVDTSVGPKSQLEASFALAIAGVVPFKALYEQYSDKRLPDREVMKDFLKDAKLGVPDTDECVDSFIVNVQDLKLLRTIGGAETLISIEQAIDELADADETIQEATVPPVARGHAGTSVEGDPSDWEKVCFYITPIGADETEQRKHSDLFMSSLVEPALTELGLRVVRADHIGEPGMITSQVLRYLKHARLAIADLSYLNPNVFYEVALRHALKLPVVQIIRKADRLPFDVNQVRTLVLDTSDIYSLVPKLQTYRAEIATLARKALDDPESVGNPVSIFYPTFYN